MNKKIVIVGGVAGGASAAARLRRLDEEARIILLERGKYISYANCGLPYHLGKIIGSRDALLLNTPEGMAKKYNIEVRVENEVTAIDRGGKKVTVRDAKAGTTYEEAYDQLILATGSSPLVPPIPGIKDERVHTLWTVPDMDEIKAMVEKGCQKAVVVGGGFIGLEVAENLRHAGLSVSLVEMLDQVMAPLDYEMAQLVHEELTVHGVDLHLGDGVSGFEAGDDAVTVRLKSGAGLAAGLVVLAIGVRPNSALAKDAGLTLGSRGGIVTDDQMRTSDENIYAIGDVVEVKHLVTGEQTMIPLAGPANKQGRIVADVVAGDDDHYTASQGTAVAKIFDLSAASTGLNEKQLIAAGKVKGTDYETLTIMQNCHAGYYPGATPMTLKVLFAADGSRIFGAQIIGREGVDKRIDTISVAMRLGATVLDLKNLELAYAPPYSSAKDPVNMAGFVAENLLKDRVAFAPWDVVEKESDAMILDVREAAECMASSIPGSVMIPLGQLRGRLEELGSDKDKPIVVFCAIGVRGYNGACILRNNGFTNVRVYPGGMKFYMSTHYEAFGAPVLPDPPKGPVGEPKGPQGPAECIRLDCSGLQCPGPLMKVFEAMNELPEGATLSVCATDPGFLKDISAWCRRTGNTLLKTGQEGGSYTAMLQKGIQDGETCAVPPSPKEGKTIIVFSGDLDKVLASFIIANGAAAMGRPVTMFFTFWGLNVLRKKDKQPVAKTAVEKMFAAMMPRGVDKLKLSNMNMLGMGTAMMKSIMRKKNVDSLETLMKKAQKNGVKLVACTMSMDVMGIKKEEIIDGVEFAGVGSYLGDAEESGVNLFV
jgi:NADPH-dependent 2,4-dienoyl-CoA reductase/sulfur reductase-like enzyme/peroxiredoxin family protein/TusA-related sulfurtransferase/rhodanese-related sulfurtransferase